MKYKYLLEGYDILISQIQSSKKFAKEQILIMLQDVVAESFFIYEVEYVEINSKFHFKISDPIHNLHPNAPALKKGQSVSSVAALKLLIKIEKQLKIQGIDKSYVWKKESSRVYILINCELAELSEENLFLFYYNWLLKKELESSKIKIKKNISNLITKGEIGDFIHKKQLSIECFLNGVIRHIRPETLENLYEFTNEDIEKDSFRLVYIYVEKLMRYIEKDYCCYLDENSQASLKTVMESKKQLESKLAEIKSYSIDLQFDQNLIVLIEESFSKIMKLQLFQKISYNDLSYSVEFTTKLLDFIKKEKEPIAKAGLKEYLLMLNFNTLDFFDYYTDEIKKGLEIQETEVEKIKFLYEILKSINQKQLYIQNKLIKSLSTTKEQVAGWIEEEIYFLNQKRILERHTVIKLENNEVEDKMLTGLSVPQLSYFFGLLVKSGIIQSPTQRSIFKFISDHFKTKMTNSISVDSLNAKYYNVETTTKNAVREKIIELLNFSKL